MTNRYPINMGSGGGWGLDLTNQSPFMTGQYAQNDAFGFNNPNPTNYGFDGFGGAMGGLGGQQSNMFMDTNFGPQNGGYNLADVNAQTDLFQIQNQLPTGMQKWLTGYTDPKTGNQTQGLASTFGNLAVGGLGVWQGMQMRDSINDRFKYQKGFAEREYADRKASYEERLADRASARNAAKGTNRRAAA